MLPSTPLRGTFFTTFPSPLVSLPFPYFPSFLLFFLFLHAYAYYPLRAFPLFFPGFAPPPSTFSLLLLLSFFFCSPPGQQLTSTSRDFVNAFQP